jgi:hypothetical protein
LVARGAERVVVSGGDASIPARWAGPDQGTYAYFGTLAPIETPNVRAVIDLGLPKWLKARIDDLLPRVFAYYAKRTGYAVNTRPVVFISYGDEPRPGSRSIGGGTLSGIILFDVRLGARFRNENDPALADDIAHLVAHEAAHWWNGRMFANDAEDRGGAWLHEGGADGFADRVLRDLGVYSREMYHGKLSEALSLCALGLRGVPLTESSRRGRTKNWYSCGSAIALWTEAAMSEGEPKEDLFAFWNRLFDAAAERHYGEALYYRVLSARVPDVAAQIRRFVEEPVADPAQTLVAALTAHGVTVVEDESAATPKYTELVAVRVAEMVAEGDRCDGVYAQWQGRAVVLIEAERCKTLPRQATIAAIGGHALGKEAAQAWNAMTERCAGSATIDVTLSGEDHPRLVPCPRSIPRRARYLRVTRTPFDR